MPLSLVSYPPAAPAVRRVLPDDAPALLGRNPRCALRIAHPSVSELHARLEPGPEGVRLIDLDSRTGTFVDDASVRDALLPPDGAWLRLGAVECRLSPLDDDAARDLAEREDDRRMRAMRHLVRLKRLDDLEAVLDHTLRAALDLSDARRGLLLLRDGSDYRLQAAHAFDRAARVQAPERIDAVDRVLQSRVPVVLNRISGLPGERFADGGLAALPLRDGHEMLGVVYLEHDGVEPVTETEIELLSELAERATRCIVARSTERRLRLPPSQAWRSLLGAANDE